MKKIMAIALVMTAALSCFAVKRNSVKDTITEKKMGNYDDIETGNGTFRLKKMFSNELEPKEFSVMLYPRKGIVAFQYKRSVAERDKIDFDEDGRQAFFKAFEEYKADFDAKKLDKKAKKFVKKYGVARSRVSWGPFQYSTYADPKIEFGYLFVGKSPYFCINVPYTESKQKKGDIPVYYGGSILYFTRSQAEDFAKAMQPEVIQEALDSMKIVAPDGDDYDEEGISADSEEYEETSDEAPVKKSSKGKHKKVVEEEVDNSDYEEAK